MRYLNFALLTAILFFCSCQSKDKKTVTPATADTGTTRITPQEPVATKDTTVQTISLVFTGYEEGDYPHLLFKTDKGEEMDFGHPDENQLDENNIVLKDDKAAFGYKENKVMKGTKFVADIKLQTVDTHDENGQPQKAKRFRITSLRKDQ